MDAITPVAFSINLGTVSPADSDDVDYSTSLEDAASSSSSVTASVTTEGSEGIHKDSIYYFEDIIFLVEKCLFKVPRYRFERESRIFRDMFSIPQGDKIPDGQSDSQPLVLGGVSSNDFRQLLKVLYPNKLNNSEYAISTLEDWTSVLRLASLWEFPRVREHAIKKLSKLDMSPTHKISIARQFHVPGWELPALNQLVQRPEPMNMDDVQSLGIDTVLKLSALRESLVEVQSISTYGILTSTRSQMREGLRPTSTIDFTPKLRQLFRA